MDHVQYEILNETNYEWTEIVGLKIIYKIEEQQHTHTHTHTHKTSRADRDLFSC